jgi:hypothetical protein
MVIGTVRWINQETKELGDKYDLIEINDIIGNFYIKYKGCIYTYSKQLIQKNVVKIDLINKELNIEIW